MIPGEGPQARKAPDVGTLDRYKSSEIDREGWFEYAVAETGEGDWNPLWDYFNKFVRPSLYRTLRTNYGFDSEPYDGPSANLGEDIVQDAWAKTIEHFAHLQFPNSYSFTGWFHRLVKHRAIDILRRRPAFEELDLEDKVVEFLGGYSLDEETDVLRAREIRKALMSMESPLQRRVLILKFFTGFTNVEVAGILEGRTEGAIKSLQHRGLAAIGSRLGMIT